MKKSESQGFVALFTCIMISLLLLIVTLSLVSLETLQLRKAADGEQSLRAYYTAEAGVEDAVSRLLADPTSRVPQSCTANPGYDTPGIAGWTCQQISFSGAPKGTFDGADLAKTIDPGHLNSPAYRSLIIEWNQSTDSNPGNYNVGPSLPSSAAYSEAAPPLEMAIVSFPPFFKASDIGTSVKLQNALMVPRGPLAGFTVDFATLRGHGQWDARCSPLAGSYTVGNSVLSGYNCYALITGLNSATEDYLLRIRPRYLNSSYRLTFKTGLVGDGSVVQVPDGTATIDVTAKAGDAYRRVITKLPLSAGAAAGLNSVIYSDTNVCKNFDVTYGTYPVPPPAC